MRRRALVATALASKVGNGGHAAFVLAWIGGLRACGFDVVLCDRLEGVVVHPHEAERTRPELRWLTTVLGPAGLAGCWSLSVTTPAGQRVRLGLDDDAVRRYADGALLIDVMGFQDDEVVRERVDCAVYLDIDPGFAQMWQALGLHNSYGRHDAYVTVASAIAAPASRVPACDVDWIPTLPPVLLPPWDDPPAPPRRVASTIASWRGAYGPVDFEGRRYGLRVHELRRFLDLPRVSPAPLEMALAIDPADEDDRIALTRAGWTLVDPVATVGDPCAYHRYISSSAAELAVAKEMYVATRAGWVSDRTAHYLAAGRPAVVQYTGADSLPTGEGLLAFEDVESARNGLEEVFADWRRHARAARRIAERHLAAPVVVANLLDRVGAA